MEVNTAIRLETLGYVDVMAMWKVATGRGCQAYLIVMTFSKKAK
jgi:hypothetical protein